MTLFVNEGIYMQQKLTQIDIEAKGCRGIPTMSNAALCYGSPDTEDDDAEKQSHRIEGFYFSKTKMKQINERRNQQRN